MDVELGNVLTDFLQHLSRQSSLDAQIDDSKKKKKKKKWCSFTTKVGEKKFYLLVPNIEPPFPVHPLTEVQVIGSICREIKTRSKPSM